MREYCDTIWSIKPVPIELGQATPTGLSH
jgi:hypothetical protein